MTRATHIFLQRIRDHIGGGVIAGSCLITLPSHHIVRGLLVEQTGRKNEVYIWSMIVPLFSPTMTRVGLNYSERISANSFVLDGDISRLVDVVVALVDKYRPRWGALFDVKEFVREFVPRGDYGRPNMALDLAIAIGLSGDLGTCRERLAKVAALDLPNDVFQRMTEIARNLCESIDGGTFLSYVDTIEKANAERCFHGKLEFGAEIK